MAQQTWSDDPAGKVKALHIQELMDALQLWQSKYGITTSVFTNEPVAAKRIHRDDFKEQKDALNALATLVGTTWTWTGIFLIDSIVNQQALVDLRTHMNTLQDQHCYQCDACDADGCTTCDMACNADICTCDVTCYSEVCTCDATCYTEGCTCDMTCNVYRCASCNNTCYAYVCNDCGKDCGSEG